jgi:phosphoglycerate dehydrogenase-like enzyme
MATLPRVLVLAQGNHFETIFPERVRSELESFAQAVYNDLGRDMTEAELRERVGDMDACITTWGSPKFTADVVAAAPRLKIIAHAAGSVKPVVSDAVFARGIVVTSAAGVIARYVGEMALLFTLAALRQLLRYDAALKQERVWRVTGVPEPDTLLDQRVGLIGFGRTGREFARLLRPFDVELLIYDPHIGDAVAREYGARLVSLEEVLTTCRVISLHAASLPGTRNLLDATRLAMIPDGVAFINTARGALVDMAALVEELKKGRFTAALDVFDPEEPLPADHPLRDLPNVILTPHVAGPVRTRYWEMGRYAVDTVRRVLAGETVPDAVTAEQLATIA